MSDSSFQNSLEESRQTLYDKIMSSGGPSKCQLILAQECVKIVDMLDVYKEKVFFH